MVSLASPVLLEIRESLVPLVVRDLLENPESLEMMGLMVILEIRVNLGQM